jgi:hypothetical protein
MEAFLRNLDGSLISQKKTAKNSVSPNKSFSSFPLSPSSDKMVCCG